ncbi:hypothetical protein MYCTH_2316574 [Thermothelomyces thermophilus ATCC 42464]|uniref:RRM domain-containing protein n=1 Tax=Thermothelomyces thermophilus (strain ATCC 42464 / BCRC 31852 / DSM 1799) TaxID=573729 RepID=G2QQ08_THET4|nr:uncharacterized protein MYCTH_2316574 [Thermothelomyces thermophilus ATCC 42464]AEO61671.1 hypothetical protein MYCTH_2316574 [Thermothelomyces thermophilus ATCC 42464]
MSGKLDQSLDEILSSQRRNQQGRRRSARRSAGAAKPAATAPAGGIQKNSKPARGANKPTPAKGVGLTGESKIVVSNLPKDVSEGQIKEYFQQSVGPVKKVEISYGPGGVSRGIAHVTFHHADGASKAFSNLNGLLIDGKPVKVEIVVASADLIPQPPSLAQRMTQPKPQPKSAATVKKNTTKDGKGGAAGGKGGKKGGRGRASRPKKTAEELDLEMADYFENRNNENNANGAAPAAAADGAAAGGDAAMEEDVL